MKNPFSKMKGSFKISDSITSGSKSASSTTSTRSSAGSNGSNQSNTPYKLSGNAGASGGWGVKIINAQFQNTMSSSVTSEQAIKQLLEFIEMMPEETMEDVCEKQLAREALVSIQNAFKAAKIKQGDTKRLCKKCSAEMLTGQVNEEICNNCFFEQLKKHVPQVAPTPYGPPQTTPSPYNIAPPKDNPWFPHVGDFPLYGNNDEYRNLQSYL